MQPAPPPEVTAIEPAYGYNGEDTVVQISGKHFYPQVEIDATHRDRADVNSTFSASLQSQQGRYELTGVSLQDYHHLAAIVPAGLPVGTYELVVDAPTGGSGTLAEAFLVTDTRADHLYVEVEDSVSYTVFQPARLTVELEDPEGESVFDSLEIELRVENEEGYVAASFGDEEWLEDQENIDGGIRGKLGPNGRAQVELALGTPDLVTVTVAPVDAQTGIDAGSIVLEWLPDGASKVTIDFVDAQEPLEFTAGVTFDVELNVIDQYLNPVEEPTVIVLQDDCETYISDPITVSGSKQVPITLEQATDETCPTNRLHAVIGPDGQSESFIVRPAEIDHFDVHVSPPMVVAGERLHAFITPRDAFENETVWSGDELAISDSVGGVPTDDYECIGVNPIFCDIGTVVAASDVTLEVRVPQDDGDVIGVSDPYDVLPGNPFYLDVDVDSSTLTAGLPEWVTVMVTDQWDNLIDLSEVETGSFSFSDSFGTVPCVEVVSGDVKAFDCTFTRALDQEQLSVFITDLAVAGVSETFEVVNGALASVSIEPAVTQVTAGEPLALEFSAFDAFGNPYVVQADPALDISDSGESIDIATVTLASDGTATVNATFTRAGATMVSAAQGTQLGTSPSITVEAADPDALEVTVDEPWIWVGDLATVSVAAVDVYGNVALLDATATITSGSGASAGGTVALVDGLGSTSLVWTTPEPDEQLDASAGAHTGSSGRIVVVESCVTGPSAELSFSGADEGIACFNPSAGTATIPVTIGTGGVLYALSVDDQTSLSSSAAMTIEVDEVGEFAVRGLAVDLVGCAEESASTLWVGEDDGEAVGRLDVSVSDSSIPIGSGSTDVIITGATDCAGDPASAATIRVRSDRGVLALPATGAGLSLALDSNGDGTTELDLLGTETGGTAVVRAWADSGAARGDIEVEVTGDDKKPIVWSQTPAGVSSGMVSAVEIEFSEPLLESSVVASLFELAGPGPNVVSDVELAGDARAVTVTFDSPVDASLGTWVLTVISDSTGAVRDLQGNKLDGEWIGSTSSYLGEFGAMTSSVDPVTSCSPTTAWFVPDGDPGIGNEADAVTFGIASASKPKYWVVSIETESGVLIRREFVAAGGPADSWTWDARDVSEAIVGAGDYTILVDSDDGMGNRGGSCSTVVSVVQRSGE